MTRERSFWGDGELGSFDLEPDWGRVLRRIKVQAPF